MRRISKDVVSGEDERALRVNASEGHVLAAHEPRIDFPEKGLTVSGSSTVNDGSADLTIEIVHRGRVVSQSGRRQLDVYAAQVGVARNGHWRQRARSGVWIQAAEAASCGIARTWNYA